MKLFISFDSEGFAGITFWHEIFQSEKEFGYYRKLITEQINELCYALFDKYKDLEKITLCDSHAWGNNYLYETLPENVELIKGFPRRYYMMEGLDNSYDGVAFIGYHTQIGGIGNLDHTYSSSIFEIKINGEIVDEFLINSHFAGEIGVPVFLALGGDKFVENARKQDVKAVVLKEELGKFSAKMPSLSEVKRRIREGVEKSDVKRDGRLFNEWLVNDKVKAEIELNSTVFAETASWIPKVERIDGRKISVIADSMKEFYEILMAITFITATAARIK